MLYRNRSESGGLAGVLDILSYDRVILTVNIHLKDRLALG